MGRLNAYACQGKPEAMDELVFSAMAEVMTLFGKLTGPPQILDLPIDKAGLEAWIARQKGGNTLETVRVWATQYRSRHAR